MLDNAKVFRSVDRILTATETQANRKLQKVIAAASAGDSALGTGGIAVPLTDTDGETWNAWVLPLTSGARQDTGRAYAATAAVSYARQRQPFHPRQRRSAQLSS